jgi:WD40 repeat protein/serine/threonine protein kinase/predicted Zn-dependent protease
MDHSPPATQRLPADVAPRLDLPIDDPRLIQALEEYRAALESGHRPSRQSVLVRFPEIASALGGCLAALEFVHQVASRAGQVNATELALGGGVSASQPRMPLGDYRIIREVGRGGMGVVYEAEQLSLGRRVALKVLPFASALDAKQLQRFRNEAQAAAHLHHQHIVPVYSVGSERGVHFYAMQFIEGRTLAAMIAELRPLPDDDRPSIPLSPGESQGVPPGGPLPAPPVSDRSPAASDPDATSSYAASADAATGPPQTTRWAIDLAGDTDRRGMAAGSTDPSSRGPAFFRMAARLGQQAAEALEHAHQMGVIHRDIKPSNLLIDARGNLWVTDFGLAQVQGDTKLTLTGDLIGTLRYMSPEQAMANRVVVDHRTDIYSLGVTLYELLTLEPAFRGDDRRALLRQIAFEEPPAPRRINKAIPQELETIVLKAMAKNPSERYATAQELADDLDRFLNDVPIRARRPTILQRGRKFARRHKAVVATAAVSALVLVAALVVYQFISKAQLNEAYYKVRTESHLKDIAITGRDQALLNLRGEQRLTKVNFSKFLLEQGLGYCDQGRFDVGMLWLSRSLQNAPPDDHDLQRVIRANLSAYHPYLLPLVRPGQALPIKQMAYSADGNTVVALAGISVQGNYTLPRDAEIVVERLRTMQGGVSVADANTGQIKYEPIPHRGLISAAALSPDGRTAVVGVDHQTVQLWDLETRRPIGQPLAHPDSVIVTVFSDDGRVVATSCGKLSAAQYSADFGFPGAYRVPELGSVVQLWDAATAQPIGQAITPGGVLSAVVVSPDGQLVLTARGRTARLWNSSTGELHGPPIPNDGLITAAAFSPDGKYVAVMGEKAPPPVAPRPTPQTPPGEAKAESEEPPQPFTIHINMRRAGQDEQLGAGRLWEVATGKPASSPLAPIDPPRKVIISPDLQAMITYGGAYLELWYIHKGMGHYRLGWSDSYRLGREGEVLAATFSPDSRVVAASRSGVGAVLWDVANAIAYSVPFRSPGEITCLLFRPDGRVLRAGSSNGAIQYLDTVGTRMFFRGGLTSVLDLGLPANRALGCVFSSDGSRLLTSGDGNKDERQPDVIQLWDVTNCQDQDLARDPRFVAYATLHRFGGQALYVSPYPPPQAKRLSSPLLLHSDCSASAMNHDGSVALVGSLDGSVYRWRNGEWRQVELPPEFPRPVVALALSADGQRVLVSARGRHVRLYSTQTWQPLGPPLAHDPHEMDVELIALAPDGTLAATATKHKQQSTAQLWLTASGTRIGTPLAHRAAITVLAFRPDGRLLATGSFDNTVRLWETATGRPQASPLQHGKTITALVFSPDGQTLLAGDAGRYLLFWDVALAKRVGPGMRGSSTPTALAWHGPSASFFGTTETTFGPEVFRGSLPPPPLAGSAERIDLWTQSITQRDLDTGGVVGVLDAAKHKERVQQLKALGGPPLPPLDPLAWHRHELASAEFEQFAYTAFWHLERLIAAEPKNPLHYLARGRVRAIIEQYPQAVQDYSQAIALGAIGYEVWARRGKAHRKLGQWPHAAADLEQAANLSGDIEIHCAWAEACLRAADQAGYNRACAELLRRCGAAPHPAHALEAARTCLLDPSADVDPTAVVKLAETALAGAAPTVFRASDKSDEKETCLWVLALALYRAGDYEAAIPILHEATDLATGRYSDKTPYQNIDWFLLLALCHQKMQRPQEARAWLSKAETAITSRELGEDLAWLRRQAEEVFGVVLPKAPPAAQATPQSEDWKYFLDRGRSYAELGDHENALADFSRAIELKGDEPEPWRERGLSYATQRLWNEALADLSKAIDLKRTSPEFWYQRALAYYWASNPEKALADLNMAIGLAPNFWEPYFLRGTLLYQRRQWEEAVRDFSKVLKDRPNHGEAANNRGLCYWSLRRYREAAEDHRAAIRAKPDFVEAHFGLGLALDRLGEYEAAAAAYQQAIQLRPSYAEAHCNLGYCLVRLGRLADALAERRRGHELGSQLPGWNYPSAKWVAECERLLALQQRYQARPFFGHTANVRCLALDAAGRHALSGAYDRSVRWWDIPTGRELWRIGFADPKENHAILSVAISPDGTRGLAGSSHGTVWLLDLEKGQMLQRCEHPQAGKGEAAIHGLAFSPDGKQALLAGSGGLVRLWDIAGWKELGSVQIDAGLWSVAFDPNGQQAVVAGGTPGSVNRPILSLWNVKSGTKIRDFAGHTAGVWHATFSPDGRYVLSSSIDKSLRLWEAETGTEVGQFAGHTAAVRQAVFTGDGRLVLSAADDGTVRLWDVETRQELHRLDAMAGGVAAVAISPDGRTALASAQEGTFWQWPVPERAAIEKLPP